MKLNKGFTLIELLIVVAIMIAIGSSIAGVIASTMRTSKKTDNIEKVRQSGNHALSQIARNIEYARSFEGVSHDGSTYVTSCPVGSTIYEFIRIKTSSNELLEYYCNNPVPPFTPVFTVEDVVSGNVNSIVDINTIKIASCSITCTQVNLGDVPMIGISFELDPIVLGSTSVVENSAPAIRFETSVVMRNYVK